MARPVTDNDDSRWLIVTTFASVWPLDCGAGGDGAEGALSCILDRELV